MSEEKQPNVKMALAVITQTLDSAIKASGPLDKINVPLDLLYQIARVSEDALKEIGRLEKDLQSFNKGDIVAL